MSTEVGNTRRELMREIVSSVYSDPDNETDTQRIVDLLAYILVEIRLLRTDFNLKD